MSHFLVTVIVEREHAERIHDRVEELLAPFDENLDVDPYDRECYCVGRIAHNAGRSAAEAHAPIDLIRQTYWALPENERTDALWQGMTAEHIRIREETEQAHPMFGLPNPECDKCNGTGVYKSTYNPDSKWDWWVIGGRWEGEVQSVSTEPETILAGPAALVTQAFRTSLQAQPNTCMVHELPADFIPYAILTPDGTWHQKGEMGWFGMAANEKAETEWRDEVRLILDRYTNEIAVGVDCHI